jgi:hypothetical protein
MGSHNTDQQYFVYTVIYVFKNILPDDGLPRPKPAAKTNKTWSSCVLISIFHFILIRKPMFYTHKRRDNKL